MKEIIYSLLVICLFGFSREVQAQKYFTKEGKVSFYSKAPLEDIEAHNEKATAVIDLESGKMEWAVLIKAFNFQKALMQEHFNENYMESNKFPKAVFKGFIVDYSPKKLEGQLNYNFTLKGELTIHGVTNPIEALASLQLENGKLSGESEIIVLVADYGIKIPGIVKDKIGKEVKVSIASNFTPM